MSLWLALNLSVLLCLGGCSDDNDPIGGGGGTVGELVFDWKVESDAGDPVLLLSDETYVLSYHAEGVESISLVDVPAGWQVTVDEEAGNVTVAAPSSSVEADKNYTLQLVVAGADNQSITTEGVNFYHVTFDEPEGAFVLNEGNMTTENGSLVYITPEGYVVDDAYKRVNGTELGNVAQDMCFYDGKIYIISQNGDTNAVGSSFENDGMLVVADAVTLKKLRSFTNEELSRLDWPTHIAVIDEQHVYIRDNAGVWCLNMDDRSLSFVDGTENAPKARLATVNNEVYFPLSGSYMAYVKKIAPSTGQVSSVGTDAIFSASTMINYILGIAPADDGNLWIIATSASNPDREGMITLNKLDLATSELVQNRLTEQPDDVAAGVEGCLRHLEGERCPEAEERPEGEGGAQGVEPQLRISSQKRQQRAHQRAVAPREVGPGVGQDAQHDKGCEEHRGGGDVVHFAPSEPLADGAADDP